MPENKDDLAKGKKLEEMSLASGGKGGAPVRVTLQRTDLEETPDQWLWIVIRNRTKAIHFPTYQHFLDSLTLTNLSKEIGTDTGVLHRESKFRYHGVGAYQLLKAASQLFLMHEAGVKPVEEFTSFGAFVPPDEPKREREADIERLQQEEQQRVGGPVELRQMRNEYLEKLEQDQLTVLPYFKLIRERLLDLPVKSKTDLPFGSYGILSSSLTSPVLIELIWSYWLEAGMLVQAINAIAMRFQNRKQPDGRPILTNLEIDPLRPLSNFFWGYIQDEVNRLSVLRRAHEYEHEYGLRLYGKAVTGLQAADSRSRFLEAFHSLLNLTAQFYKLDDDTTKIADGFPLISSLRELNMILALGAQNQFNDLPWTARVEMMIQQYLLSRPEIRDFLGGRYMVPYPEAWMDRVDTINTMQGWTDVSVTHFRDLAVYGEQILLSVRYGAWTEINDPQKAANWARYWRAEIQGYIQSYRAVTGVNLAAIPVSGRPDGDQFRQPAEYLRERAQRLSARQ